MLTENGEEMYFIIMSTGAVVEHGTLEEMERLYEEKYKALSEQFAPTGVRYHITWNPDLWHGDNE